MSYGPCTGRAAVVSQCLVYLDDVIVLGKSFLEHLQNLQVVFHRMSQAGLTLKPSNVLYLDRKCSISDILCQKMVYQLIL